MPRCFSFLSVGLLAAIAAGTPVSAHTEAGAVGGLISGFLHPISGLDHVVAMIAVGIWGAYLGKPSIWLLPVVFPTIMAVGGALGILGVPVPPVEVMIALSGVVLGLMIVFAVRLPAMVAAAIVGVFAIFHGYAHGAELPAAANPMTYAVGFVVGTGFLHAIGIGFSALRSFPRGDILLRGTGAAIALVGTAFLTGLAP